MEKMNDLKDLLRHEVQDLHSAEDQIIAALPMMIEKATNVDLKKALHDHLDVTSQHRSRLEKVRHLLGGAEENIEKKSLLSRLFRSRQVCRGMQGLIEEGNKIMREDMHPEVLDAVIISCVQKIEHYEICAYGTARTFARELNLQEITQLLEQTLGEEYAADDILTQLAVTQINKRAEKKGNKKADASLHKNSKQTEIVKKRKTEPQIQMASQSSMPATTAKRHSAIKGGAPKKTEPSRNSISRNRNNSNAKPAAASNVKSETKPARNNAGSVTTKSSQASRGRGGSHK